MKVKHLMTLEVIKVAPEDTIQHAIRLMLQNKISGLPVVDSDKLVGIVTEGDFLRRIETGTERKRHRWLEFLIGPGRLADEYVHTHGRKVSEVMTVDPYTVGEDADVGEVVRLMEQHRVKRLPVMRGDELVGIISRANLMQATASLARAVAPGTGDDAAIRDNLIAQLGKQEWAPLNLINIAVNDGVVELSGAITDIRQRNALKVAAENIPGVAGVRDNLVWIDLVPGQVF